ncbi:Protein MEMO1 [Sarcoptes scabiei]|nr:Protein MEMO1 [Sarcoptes scabiei]
MQQSVLHRRAIHAGSWYSSSELDEQLSDWLQKVDQNHFPAKAIISPHAGYQYCGACAAFAYKQIDPQSTERIFILGPSHHIRLNGCALSPTQIYKTPFYDLRIDQDVYEELRMTNQFQSMTLAADEDEHSIEMQLPFIAKIMESKRSTGFSIVPILVGSLSTEKEHLYGQILSKYLLDPGNVTIISSDFCHWGNRFSFQFYNKAWGEIHQSIKKLDEMGMNIIEAIDPAGFAKYLQQYRNTICGRHPIAVLLNAIKEVSKIDNSVSGSLRFLKYAQSSQCLRMRDSSVSYAAASYKMI